MQRDNTTACGLCKCGCGQSTALAKWHDKGRGHVKGHPMPFVQGHHGTQPTYWVEEDRGYSTPCRIYQLAKSKDGHGRILRGGRFVMAHRFFYAERFGPVDPAIHLHHKCEVESCVNPDHLEPMTPAEHRQRHARLTADDVREIRRKRAEEGTTYQALGDEFGISRTMAWQIVKRQTWKGV